MLVALPGLELRGTVLSVTMQLEHSRQTEQAQVAGPGGHRDGKRQAHDTRPAFKFSPIDKASDLQSSWISLLGRYQWDLFGSLTFREETHPESAMKRFRLFVSMINRKLYGPRWAKHGVGVSWCVAVERQRRGVLHFHCLLADPELTNLLKGSWFKLDGRWANELNEMWNELAGFARIEPIHVAELVQRYVSKYVVKGGEIDLGGPMMQRRLEQAGGGSDATTRQRGGCDLGGISDSVPVPFIPARARGERVDVQDTSTRSPHPSLTGCSAVPGGLLLPSGNEQAAQGTGANERRAIALELFSSAA